MRVFRAWMVVLIVAGAIGVFAASGRAQEELSEKAIELQSRAFNAIAQRKYDLAERLLREQLALDEGNFVVYYNLACVRSLQGDGPGSAELLVQAVEHGFVDLYQLQHDPQLAAARAQEPIKKLVEKWPEVLLRQLEANLKVVRKAFPDLPVEYKETRNDAMRLVFRSAMDQRSTSQAVAGISKLYEWGLVEVFPELKDEKSAQLDAWCVVVLPTPKHFLTWAVQTFGVDAVTGNSGIGGAYVHDLKRLVAQDLGGTLRHEFFHVLHWRSNVRLGQDHPIWIQEGLCSLVEDYEAGADGTLKPVPSWRTNISKRLVTSGKLLSIQKLATIPRGRFTNSSPLANYAQARTFFLYLFEQKKLKEWYATYTRDYRKDPTGVKAIESVFGKPIADVDKDYRLWVRSLPMVAEQIKQGNAGLGAEVDAGSGDGPVIAEVDRNGPAKQAGLRKGDVITAIDERPTRDLNELVRILGEHAIGDTVEVSYRRGSKHAKVTVKLVRR